MIDPQTSFSTSCPNSCIVGINTYRLTNLSFYYPNPNGGAFTITLDKLIDGTKIEVLNSLGQQIWKQENIKTFAVPVTLKKANSGIYFIKISSVDGVNIQKDKVDLLLKII